MHALTPWNNTLWLADPAILQRVAHHVATLRPCPTREQIRARHREVMTKARGLPQESADVVELRAAIFDGFPAAIPARVNAQAMQPETAAAKMPEVTTEVAPEVKADAPKAIRAVKGKIGVIPVHGPIGQHMTGELDKAGGTSIDFISMALDRMLANSAIGAIVLHVDSPGGGIYGVQELSDKIFAARSQMPIYAIADSMSASAAYWISTSATMQICTPGGDVGSVGVYNMHVDETAALEEEGITITMVSAGQYKVEFSPYGALSDDARAELQSRVDAIHEKFLGALKRNRDTSMDNVRNNFGQGRVVRADKALAAGMIDRIMTFEELIGKLTGGDPSGAGQSSQDSRGASAEQLRLRLAQTRRRDRLAA